MFGHNLSFPKIMPYPFRDVAVHLKRVFDAYGPQRSYWGTDLTNSYAKASYRQRISQFTEELSLLSESDKDWAMGRAIVQRLSGRDRLRRGCLHAFHLALAA